jgi:hypothetical protein
VTFDVIIYDSIGMPVDWTQPLGGTEAGHHVLALALRELGLTVKIQRDDEPMTCRALILSRWSPRPRHIGSVTAAVMAHDLYRPEYYRSERIPHVFVSHFQKEGFPRQTSRDRVIYPVMGDHVRMLASVPKIPNRWIYPTAANKGLVATLERWKQHFAGVRGVNRLPESIAQLPGSCEQDGSRWIAQRPELVVTSSGYDEPPPGLCEQYGARWIGKRPPEGLALEIARSTGIFYANTAPETFGMTVAIGRALGCTLAVACHGHPYCGLAESSSELDLTPKTIALQWATMMELT